MTAPPAKVQTGGNSRATSQAQSGERVGSTRAINESCAAGTLREPMVTSMSPREKLKPVAAEIAAIKRKKFSS